MAKGYNTYIWGPPLWRILHTLAHASPNDPRVGTWLTTLCDSLPCSFCRSSYSRYLDEMEQKHGLLVTVVKERRLERWMYDLHELVNDKLDHQHFKKVLEPVFHELGCDVECDSRRISFECVRKRYTITPVAFCDQDVWSVLAIFALNYPTRLKTSEQQHKAQQFCIFVLLLPDILELSGGGGAAAAQKLQVALPMDSGALQSDDAMLEWVARAKGQSVDGMRRQYSLAEAGACVDGSCV